MRYLLFVFFLFSHTVYALQVPEIHASLSNSESLLKTWQVGIYVVEVKTGGIVGTYANPPVTTVEIIEEIRKPDQDLQATGVVSARWQVWVSNRWDTSSGKDPTTGKITFSSTLKKESLSAPEAGQRLIVFAEVHAPETRMLDIVADSIYKNTPENRATARRLAEHKSLSEIISGPLFFCLLFSPIIGFGMMAFGTMAKRPKYGVITAVVFVALYFIYESTISRTAIRMDLIFIWPAIGIDVIFGVLSSLRLEEKYNGPRADR